MVRSSARLPTELLALAAGQKSAMTGAQLRSVMGERAIRRATADGNLVKLWRGAYAVRADETSRAADPSRPAAVPALTRLSAARLTLDRPVTACLHTAAEIRTAMIDPAPSSPGRSVRVLLYWMAPDDFVAFD